MNSCSINSCCYLRARLTLRYRSCLMIVIILLLIFTGSNKILKIFSKNRNTREFLNKINTRSKRVYDVCTSTCFKGKCSTLKANHIYWLKTENVAFCPIFKSATSTWRNHLINLLNQTHPKVFDVAEKRTKKRIQVHDKLIQLGAINPKSYEFVSYVKNLPEQHNLTAFMVVRHPFERLVSAYRDKLERNNLEEPFYYKKFGKYFVEKYRDAAIKQLGESYFSKQNNFGTPINVKNNRRPNASLPSFWEFAQSVIDGYKIDEHWEPINEYCSLCNSISMKAFRYILKFEELEDEESMFLNHAGWYLGKEDLGSKLNVNRPDDIPGNELTLLYLSVLSEKQIKDLYEVYKLDFLLFDYSFDIGDVHLPP